MKEKILIVDGMNLIFRAYFATFKSGLKSPDGFPTGAVSGFFNSLFRVIDDHAPVQSVIAFDSPVKTFRHEKYQQYKAKRQSPPADLLLQIPKIRDLCISLGFICLEKEGFEADDIIGTLVERFTDTKYITVYSGDRDLFQLLDREFQLLMPKSGAPAPVCYTKETFMKEYFVTPEQYLQVKSLMGDPSDNIPGVPGIGEKTAFSLIRDFQNLENVYQNLDSLSPSVRKKLSENRASADLSLMLSRICRNAPVPDDIFTHSTKKDLNSAVKTLQELSLNSLLKKIGADIPAKQTETVVNKGKYICILKEDDWKSLLDQLEKCSVFAIDLETDSENHLKTSIVGISAALKPGEAYYIPLNHSYLGTPAQLDQQIILSQLKPLLENPEKLKICHNFKFEYTVFERYGIIMKNVFDTMLASYLLDPDDHRHGLEYLCQKHFNLSVISFDSLFGKGVEKNFSHVLVEQATDYSGEDSDFTLRLYYLFSEKLKKENLAEVYQTLEMPLVKVLSDIEKAGILIDQTKLRKMSSEFDSEIRSLEKKILQSAGCEFNLNSPKQLETVLFEKLGLPSYGKTTKGTGNSTDVTVLEKLTEHHEIASLILQYRGLAKLKSTYIDAMPRMADPASGRVHTSFNQTVAATGRLSSSSPNLQNIPVRTAEGRKIRECFIAPQGTKLLSFDYSQIELRILAHISGDQGLIEAFSRGEDIHRNTAAWIFDVPAENVVSDMRRKAKEINFGVVYGLNAYGLATRLSITPAEAKHYLSRFFSKYPGISSYIKNTIAQAETDGFVTTISGRKRWLTGFKNRDGKLLKHGENIAVNAPVQGSAADLMKLAMIRVSETPWKMILQIHDELIFEVPEDNIDSAVSCIRPCLENVFQLSVPLTVDFSCGENWGELK